MEQKNIEQRPPVVVVMGHIDHGKSTLLDYIRKTNVVGKEKGGITQHMSAYEVRHEAEIEGKKTETKITFLDTPGHEAFQAIRTRGAKVADIAVLVVAADDGVKPQTLEALKCIKEAGLSYIVAINKIDKEEADIEKTKNSLASSEIYLEGYGGDIPNVTISAKTGKNIDELLELIVLVSELEELKGDPKKPAEGVVIESNLDPQKGIVATLVIKDGYMKKGMFVAVPKSLAPLRMVENFLGEKIEEAAFSMPVKVIGWNSLPKVGSIFKTFKTKKEAEKYAEEPEEKAKQLYKGTELPGSEQKIMIPIIIKADTAGSLEAIKHEIKKIEGEQVHFKIVNSGIGSISENDVKGALINERAVILGFHVKSDSSANNLADRENVTIKTFDIIYNITEWLKTDLKNFLPKIEKEEITGKASVIKIFSKNKDKQVIGGKVFEGIINKGESFRIKRRDSEIGTGKIKELQHKKAEAKEIKEGLEFGALVESRIDLAEKDELEFFELKKQQIVI